MDRIISYASNHEDLMLWRALKDINNGFYIDVGAADSEIDSVTALFYKNHWSGINIEPDDYLFALLKQQRPRDINLNCVISDTSGFVDFASCGIDGWSTFEKKRILELKNKNLLIHYNKKESHTLTTVLKEYLNNQSIHFLKINVQGAEAKVIKSIDLSQFRPWIIVVNSCWPETPKSTSEQWESYILNAQYTCCYHDGVNKFYLADEHQQLNDAFKRAPNMWDNYQDFKYIRLNHLLTKTSKDLHIAIEELNYLKHNFFILIQKRLKKSIKIFLYKFYIRYNKSKIVNLLFKCLNFLSPLLLGVIKHYGKVDNIYSMKDASLFESNYPNSRKWLVNVDKRDFFYPLNAGLIIYYVVPNTIQSKFSTGVQQVARNLFVALVKQGCTVIPVKWNFFYGTFQEINYYESHIFFSHLLLEKQFKKDLMSRCNGRMIEFRNNSPGLSWVLVPELTYNIKDQFNLTEAIIRKAKAFHLFTACIFHDAIPVFNFFNTMKKIHVDYLKALTKFDLIFSISTFSTNQLFIFCNQYGINLNPSSVININLACSFLDVIKKRSNKLPTSPYMLTVGSIQPNKNKITLIKAFQLFKKKYPNNPIKLVLIGKLNDHLPCDLLTKDILFLESASTKVVVSAYQHCEFTVFPSILEGFGLPIIESLHFNKPCITANFGAMREVAGEQGCLLTDTRFPEALAASIEKMVMDKSFFEKKQAEAIARKIDSWDEYAGNLLQVINQKIKSYQETKIESEVC